MTTNLLVIPNVNNCEPAVVLEFYCIFPRTFLGAGVLNSAIFNSLHNLVEFGTILEGLQNFGDGGGGVKPTNPTPSVHHCLYPLGFKPQTMQPIANHHTIYANQLDVYTYTIHM